MYKSNSTVLSAHPSILHHLQLIANSGLCIIGGRAAAGAVCGGGGLLCLHLHLDWSFPTATGAVGRAAAAAVSLLHHGRRWLGLGGQLLVLRVHRLEVGHHLLALEDRGLEGRCLQLHTHLLFQPVLRLLQSYT